MKNRRIISSVVAAMLTLSSVGAVANAYTNGAALAALTAEIAVDSAVVTEKAHLYDFTVPESGTLITVIYDENKNVVKTELDKVSAGEAVKKTVTLSGLTKGTTRFMLWNGFKELIPLTNVAEKEWEKKEAKTIKVMPLGDSITDGFTGSPAGGYRDTLTAKIQADGISSYVDFVGSQEKGAGYDNNHEGHSGWAIEAISSGDDIEKSGRKGLATNIDSWMSTHKPDVVLLQIGTNDILSQYKLDEAQARLQSLANKINNGLSEGGKVYIAKIPYISQTANYNKTGKDQATLNAQVDAFNEAVVAVAEKSGFEVVDMNSLLTFSDLKDGIHPSAGGYEKMGNLWYETINYELNKRIYG